MIKVQQHSFQQQEAGILYLVPTPIGNLEDMTFRAVNILKDADIVLAEDTRNTIKLLNHFDIQANLRSFHEHSRSNEVTAWVKELQDGKMIALVSDAGMPLINDPGQPLVQACLEEELSVVALPGANAALTALVASGLPSEQFTYYGFFPRGKSDQKAALEIVGQRDETAIFYESPYRIKQAVAQIVTHLGEDTRVVIGRELTKRYEEYIRGSASEVSNDVQGRELKGECVLLIEGGTLEASQEEAVSALPYKEHVELIMSTKGIQAKDAIKEVAKIREVKKQIVYNDYHDLT
ncbi:16S rRNA (cytidine(1402)-2'-O)-methyltransferase [Aerococcaceae bacterium DSM 111021]|nr:16S rRNA (cytidine(1402)-2'-O)-methyltransferase [Aerococcaceae bacterium DSM 111021]